MPSFTRTILRTKISKRASGSFIDADFDILLNDAVREVVTDVKLRSMIRKSDLAPNLFDDVYQHTCPSDLNGIDIIDLKPQNQKRSRFDYWELVTSEEFDRYKMSSSSDNSGEPIEINAGSSYLGRNLIAIQDADFARTLLISKPVDDDELVIDTLDSIGDWLAFGDGTNLTKDSENYVKGSASINWDINADGGTTAGIQNTSLTTFDISDYVSDGSAFVWAYLSDATDVTNFILRIGNSASNYYYVTVTADNAGNSFQDGWNLLRFDLNDKTETGTVTDDECDYAVIYMTKDSGKTSETDFRFDNLVLKIGKYWDLYYYSNYGWQTSAGVWAEESSGDTDLVNATSSELQLILYKGLEFVEDHLQNAIQSEIYAKKYQLEKAKYQRSYPSRVLTSSSTYYNI